MLPKFGTLANTNPNATALERSLGLHTSCTSPNSTFFSLLFLNGYSAASVRVQVPRAEQTQLLHGKQLHGVRAPSACACVRTRVHSTAGRHNVRWRFVVELLQQIQKTTHPTQRSSCHCGVLSCGRWTCAYQVLILSIATLRCLRGSITLSQSLLWQLRTQSHPFSVSGTSSSRCSLAR